MLNKMFSRPCLLAALLSSSLLYAADYKLDNSHTSFGFAIKHLVVSTVRGHFKEFDGKGSYDPKTGKINNLEVTMQASSIDTNEPKRDEHLRSPDFFDVQKFKELSFKSTSVDYKKDPKTKKEVPSQIHGNLTMHGVTKPVTLVVDWGGLVTDPWGNEKLIFSAEGAVDRTAYGLNWNKPLEKAAGVLVANEVKLEIQVEAQAVDLKKDVKK